MDIDTLAKPASPEPKAWGSTWPVIETDRYGRYALDVVKGGYSSIHYHRERANRFVVQQGTILVWTFYGNRILQSEPITDGGTFQVPSLVVHAFAVLEPGRVVEEYWADRGGAVSRDDIVRLCHGGRVDDTARFATLARELLENAHP